MTYAFVKYWVEGTIEAIHQIYEAIEQADGWAEKTIENLGLDTDMYETNKAEWCKASIDEKDDKGVLYFEEYYPYERGTIIDQLMDDAMFKGKLTAINYYVEEGACADLYQTNDMKGKYWPYRLKVSMLTEDKEVEDLYFKKKTEAVHALHEKYGIPQKLNSLHAIKKYVDDKSDDEEAFWYHDIEVVTAYRMSWEDGSVWPIN